MNDPVAALDEWPIIKGIGKKCFKCEKTFEPGDEVVVSPGEHGGDVEAVFGECADCGDKHIPETDREEGYDQFLLKFKVKPTHMGLVLDAGHGVVLDHSPPDDGH